MGLIDGIIYMYVPYISSRTWIWNYNRIVGDGLMAPLTSGPKPSPPKGCTDPECDILNSEHPYNYNTTGMTPREINDKDIQIYNDIKSKVVGEDGGMKNDKDKADWSIFKPLFKIAEGVVRILMYGEKKYKRNNWQKVSIDRNFAALMRHITKWVDGEELDSESGLHHLDHALCDLMFIRWQIKNEVD